MTIFYNLIFIFLSILIGYLFINLFWAGKLFKDFFLKLFLAVGFGMGFSSCIYFLWRHFFMPSSRSYIFVELIILALLIPALFFSKRQYYRQNNSLFKPLSKICLSKTCLFLGIILVGVTFIAIINFIQQTLIAPHGFYDAWSIWNLHARILFRGGEYWQSSFAPALYHADYPLLIPANIARIWTLTNAESIRTPAIIGLVFMLSTAGLLFSSIFDRQKPASALLAPIVLLGTPWFVTVASYQYADIPLAYFYLATCILFFIYTQREFLPGYLFLSAFFAGLAAWTKNEGILFLMVYIGVMAIYFLIKRPPWKHVVLLGMGLLIPLGILLLFKVQLAPPNDLFSDPSTNMSETIKRFSSMERYLTVFQLLANVIASTWQISTLIGLVIYGAIFGVSSEIKKQKTGLTVISAVLLLMGLGYFAIYIFTPWNPEVHIRTSASRVYLHLFPIFILIFFLLFNSFRNPQAFQDLP